MSRHPDCCCIAAWLQGRRLRLMSHCTKGSRLSLAIAYECIRSFQNE